MKDLLIKLGLWIASLGGLQEPKYDKVLMGYAKAGVACWPDLSLDGDDIPRKAYATAMALSKLDGPELRFAVARELYVRNK